MYRKIPNLNRNFNKEKIKVKTSTNKNYYNKPKIYIQQKKVTKQRSLIIKLYTPSYSSLHQTSNEKD